MTTVIRTGTAIFETADKNTLLTWAERATTAVESLEDVFANTRGLQMAEISNETLKTVST